MDASPASQARSVGSSPDPLKIVIVGHVDHGKSTFIGRLFHDTGLLPEGRLEELNRAAQRRGIPFEWANLMDGLQAERDLNVTIDTAQIWFRTPKRCYVLIDAPGHKEFLKNMVTGAASAEAAFLVIDAKEGVSENSRRHGYLLQWLGIRQVVVLVNKMDLADYSEARFREVETEGRAWLRGVGLDPKAFVPMAAKPGDNVASRSSNMGWWSGPTVVETLDGFQASASLDDQPLRFPVQDVYRFDNRRILVGRVESGTLRVGDRLVFMPHNKTSAVKSIEFWNASARRAARAGECVGITLGEEIFVERGAVAALETAPPCVLRKLKVKVFWMGRQPLVLDRRYKLKLATQEVECEVENIERVIDASTLGTVWSPEPPPGDSGDRAESRAGEGGQVRCHEVAELWLRTRRPVAFDVHAEIGPMGRFVIVDGFDVAGGGVVLPDSYPRRSADSLHKSENIFWNRGKVTPGQRAGRNGYPGRIIWLTGLSGSGKSSIASELERELFNMGRFTYLLDGDNIRHGLNRDLGFSPEDRKENIRRIGEVARLFADAGAICITAFISPYREDRAMARSLAKEGEFMEVFVNAPLEVCEQRDPKGLYQKARSGEIKEFTGISAPYEAPLQPELELRTDRLSIAESVGRILERLRRAEGAARQLDKAEQAEAQYPESRSSARSSSTLGGGPAA